MGIWWSPIGKSLKTWRPFRSSLVQAAAAIGEDGCGETQWEALYGVAPVSPITLW